MSNLSAFLAGNALLEEEVEYEASKRFIGSDKKPVKWKIACITSDEDDMIRKSCTKKVAIPGKKNVFIPETDWDKYAAKLAVRCITFPDLNDVELQDSYKVMGAENLLQKMLKPGEYRALLEEVQKVNGFDIGMAELVEEAKN